MITMTDIYGSKISIYITGSGFIRIDTAPEEKESGCISMTDPMARILMNALAVLLEAS